MPRLSYSIPAFAVEIGDWDATPYIDQIELSQDFPDRGNPLFWQGRLELSRNIHAIRAGLDESAFSPIGNPARWRPAQVPVRVTISGHTLPVMRIKQYTYNAAKSTGSASLCQLLEVADTSIQGKEVDKPIGADGCPLGQLVLLLLDAAFADCRVKPSYNEGEIESLTGYHDPPMATNNPIQEAQAIAASNHFWLWMDSSEAVRMVSGNPDDRPVIFRRSLGEVELEPEPDNLNFAADQVVLTGGRQVGWKPTKIEVKNAEDQEDAFDDDGRERIVETKSYAKKHEIYPDEYSASPADPNFDTSDVLAEIKTIRKFYWGIDPEVEAIPTPPAATQPSPQVSDYADQYEHGDLVQTITEIQQTRGQIFPDDYPADTSFSIAEKLVETKFAKVVYQPKGILSPEAHPADTSLDIKSLEILVKGKVEPDGKIPGKKDPETGDTKRLEKEVKKILRITTTPWQFYDESLTSTLELEPNGWQPLKPQRHTEDVGFVPSQEHLDYLAVQISRQELARRDAVRVTMPIPIEWLANHDPLTRCQIHGGEYQIENPVLTIAEGRAEFSFVGARIGSIPIVPAPPTPPPYLPGSGLQLLPVRHIAQAAGSPIADLTLRASGGQGPYVFTPAEALPSGISLAPDGSLSGTPESPFTGLVNVQVADAIGATAIGRISFDLASVRPDPPANVAVKPVAAITLELEITPVAVQGVAVPIALDLEISEVFTPPRRQVKSGAGIVLSGSDEVVFYG